MDNGTQLGIQRSRGNQIYDNLFVGGETAIEFNPDCREEDQINGFGKNTWCPGNGAELKDAIEFCDFDPQVLFPEKAMKKQTVITDRDEALDGFRSRVDGAGSNFVPEEKYIKIYKELI